MELEFLELKVKNFLSFGNVEQTVKLNKNLHTLVTGLNKDKSNDDEGNTNGVGKSSLFQALHFALYNKAIGNRINLPNLVNNINKKHMEVTLTFRKNDVIYKIERGRNPNYLHFYKGEDEITDEALGDSRDTQSVIEDVIGMNEDLFCQTILLSCSVPIFMEQSTANQKLIIEKVLGIDIITKKINALKEVIKGTKQDINNEEFTIQTINTQTKALEDTYNAQLQSFIKQKDEWLVNHKKQLDEKKSMLKVLDGVDYNEEYNILKAWEHYSEANKQYQDNLGQIKSLQDTITKRKQEILNLESQIMSLEKVDIETYKSMFVYNEQVDKAKEEYNNQIIAKNKVRDRYNELCNGLKELNKEKDKLKDKKKSYTMNVCPTCGQPLNKEVAQKEIQDIDVMLQQYEDAEHRINMEILEVNEDLQSNYPEDNYKFEYKDTSPYNNVMELLEVSNKLESMKKEMSNANQMNAMLQQQLTNITINVPDQPTKTSKFRTEQEMYSAKAQCEQLRKDIEQLEKEDNNLYDTNIEDLKDKLSKLTYANTDKLKELQDNQQHNEILLKLLNSPSSYIRQAILDKSLEFLNTKIRYYLNKLGSLHLVKFNNDMSIEISSNGLEYGCVSSGEMGRITIALTFAFRDAWESLSGIKTNLLMIDEMIDRLGLDINGKQLLLNTLLENTERNTFLVSHDAIISNQVRDKLMIVKERNFSTIEV